MCGITAISRVAERSSINDPRAFMRLAALAIETRGKDATGFAWCNDDQTTWYWKKQGPAHEVVDLAPLDRNMQTVIGHTRWATQGDVKDNENNHPVVDDGVMLVHNGIIDNDWELYDWLGKDFIPKAQVDSQVVATMLCHPEVFYAKHYTDLLGMIEGTAAFAWIHTSQPGTLHLARLSGRPLTIGWTRRGDLVMSSTPQTLQRLAQLANVKIRKFREIDEGTYLRVIDGEIVEEATFAVMKPKPRVTSFLSYGTYTTPKSYTTSPKGALTPVPEPQCKRFDALNDNMTYEEVQEHYDTCTLPVRQCDLCAAFYCGDFDEMFDDEFVDDPIFDVDDEDREPMVDEIDEFGLVRLGAKLSERPGWKLLGGN